MKCPKTGADCVNCTVGFCALEAVVAEQATPTPRTEARKVLFREHPSLSTKGEYVPADLASQLERELAAKTAECERLRRPKEGLMCGDVAISTDPRYAGWVFVKHVDGINWTTGAKLTPETWGMVVRAALKDSNV